MHVTRADVVPLLADGINTLEFKSRKSDMLLGRLALWSREFQALRECSVSVQTPDGTQLADSLRGELTRWSLEIQFHMGVDEYEHI
jgi:hypothetical protein